MKIAVLTGCLDDFMPLGKHTIYENKAEYCERHGYHLEIIREVRHRYRDPKSHARGFSWSRLEHLSELLAQGYFDWIWTVGGDTLVTNQAIRLEDIIATALTPEAQWRELPVCPEFSHYGVPPGHGLWPRNSRRTGAKHLIVAGECAGSLQADSFIVKCSPEGRDWARDILSCYPAYKHHVWAEQRAMMDRIEKHAPITHIVPQHALNSCDPWVWRHLGGRYLHGRDLYGHRGHWEPGDFIVHWGGLPMSRRLFLLEKYWPLIQH